MTYSYHLGGGCIINLNQVFLITERSLVLLTGTTCVGEEALFPAVNGKGEEWEVAVTGVSCRQQIEDGTGRKARHLVEILRDALA